MLGAIAAAAGVPSGVADRPEAARPGVAQPEAAQPEAAQAEAAQAEAAHPEAGRAEAGRAEAAIRPGPALAVPAEPLLRPDRHDRRDSAGNGSRPAVQPPTQMTRMAMWAYLGQAEAPTAPLPVIPAAEPEGVTEKTSERPDAAVQPGPVAAPAAGRLAVPAQRAPAEEGPGRLDHGGARTADAEREMTASPGQATPSRDEALSHQEDGQASLGGEQLLGTMKLAPRPGESPPWEPVPPPATMPPKFAPPKSVSPKPVPPQSAPPKPVPPELAPRPAPPKALAPPPRALASPPAEASPPKRPRRAGGFKVGVALVVVLAAAGSLALLLKWTRSTVQAPAPTTGASGDAAPGTLGAARAAAASWVAGQVSRGKPISCDPVMCRALQADGVPAADLLVLRPGGGDPLHSRVMVVTPTVTKMVGTEFLTAKAPAAIASFGSGSRQVSVRVIYPQGAAAYAAALRQDIANRKANEGSLLENQSITAQPGAARRQLRDGQIDARLVLTLAQLASQQPLSIVAFGDRAPGASPGVPLRSADLAVTGDAAGQARQMSAFAHQLQGFFAGARIRAVHLASGHDVVRVEFAAPSPLGAFSG